MKMSQQSVRLLGALAFATVVAVLLPLGLGGSRYAWDVAELALVYALFAVSWDVFCGLTGETSFGHTFFIGTAAFGTALAQTRFGLDPLPSILVGTLIGALGGLLVGALTLRHTAAVFAMVTMAVQLTFHRTLFIRSDVFGGEEGVTVPRQLFHNGIVEYVFVSALAIGALMFSMILRSSRFGRQLRASGGDTRVGLASGVSVFRVRVIGATLSGLLASIGGSLLAMHNRLANHETADDALAGLIFLLASAGGVGTLLGPWIAAVLYVAVVRESLAGLGGAEPMVIFGFLLVVIWVVPDGIGVAFRRLWHRRAVEDVEAGRE